MSEYVLAIDQGTTSTRCMIFDRKGQIRGAAQREHRQIYPKPGWVEHDPVEIWNRTLQVTEEAMSTAEVRSGQIAAVGITNQRETCVVWDRATGAPVCNAIVWQDTRTASLCDGFAEAQGIDRFRAKTGLPLATYFSGPKIRWILDNTEGARRRAETGELLCGTIDSWLCWKLTGKHITDVTNASRTLLMNIHALEWDSEMPEVLGVPAAMLPRIVSSSAVVGEAAAGVMPSLAGVPVAGILGDQQAALFGQTCFQPGQAKNTYGTGCFLLLNTGTTPAQSKAGLLTTVAYRIGNERAVYALEGSVAVAGALIQWLRDNLGLIGSSAEVEALAQTVADNGGIYFVPAFSGLFAPYWRSDARGVIVGLTRFVTKGHIARAALEATAFQVREIVEAMQKDGAAPLTSLRVDGGMVHNGLLMQIQADQLGVPVIRPKVAETTSLGVAYAAGLAVGFWKDQHELLSNWQQDKVWMPLGPKAEHEKLYSGWKKAVTRTFDWAV